MQLSNPEISVGTGASAARSINIARAFRDFGDGFVTVLLPVALVARGHSTVEIGVLATTALLGSALTTLGVGWAGARHDPRLLLLIYSGVMAATGLLLAVTGNFPALLAIAFFGTVNPTAGNVSPFVPLEHAVLARALGEKGRTHGFANYALFGALAAAAGALAAGSPDLLAHIGIARETALSAMFVLYALLGLAAGVTYRLVPPFAPSVDGKPASALGPSRTIVYKLAGLFSLDAFAGGLAVQSLLALWLFQKFGLSLWAAGLFFFWAGVLSAFSLPVAAWLAKHIGLINTMVWTHIPSSLFMILAAVSPRLDVALGLLLARFALSQMDVPTRSSYVMAVVTPPERAAAASLTNVPRSLASAAGPAIAGLLFTGAFPALPLILCGVLKIVYDLALLWTFRGVKPPEEA